MTFIFPRSWLSGLTLSTESPSSATFGVSPGQASDSANAVIMNFAPASAYTKTTAAWSAGSGNGALDTGTINNTWYHVHLIQNATSAVDVLISLSATAPTLPSGYGLFRRIGAMFVNSSGNWTSFVQVGDEFLFAAPAGDISMTGTLGTTAVLAALSVPPGVQVNALMRGLFSSATGGTLFLINSPDENAAVPNGVAGNVTSLPATAASFGGSQVTLNVRTNTSQQIRLVASAVSSSASVATYGYIDTRGRLG